MNEAKKKADELEAVHDKFTNRKYVEYLSLDWLQKCKTKAALITVNEVLKAYPAEPSESNSIYDQLEQAPRFWELVKEELESRL